MKNVQEKVTSYLLLTAASFLISLGVVWIFNSEQIVPGGVTGIGIIIYNLTEGLFPRKAESRSGITNLVINIPLFICGYVLLERKSMIRTGIRDQ